jgi:hypothetical protein
LKINPRAVDIVIFGICLFIVLLAFEFRPELGSALVWGISVPAAIIGLFFGYRGANRDAD